ncbi:MAG: orotidine 5'-phosphate decarboxylase [Omnitrophica WOR_2 bacterium RIFCSPHIGHO2_02_FULL_68_15]|nr:MAG: orotidine 5'-phosphate decarboxylase [Omnitrophica WOR_2 bacterium RIFCSPHIGHO2_02_FULL_68_15]
MTTPADQLIVALDVADLESARRLVQRLSPTVTHFKVGSELFTACGPSAVELVQKAGAKVFLDLKFHDIPNTVARAARMATRLGVWMFNVHLQGGQAMCREAMAAAQEEAQKLKGSGHARPLVLGVTLLTSMGERDLVDLGIRKTVKDQVLYLTQLAQKSGLDGVVASAQETKVLRFAAGPNFTIVTPGIRPAGASMGDQVRVETPAVALKNGASYLVVGRPITEAADPAAAASAILKEMAG